METRNDHRKQGQWRRARRAGRSAWSAAVALVCALTGFVPAPAQAVSQPIPLRLMTYNTALMNLRATVYFEHFAPLPISIDTNSSAYGGKSYADRIQLMADQIKKDDADVVVLNEVWSASSKDAFIDQLATNGPYTHYIRRIKGKAPGLSNPFAKPNVGSAIELVAAALVDPLSPALQAFNLLAGPLLPSFALTGNVVSVDVQFLDSGIMLFSKKPFALFDSPSFLNDPSIKIDGANGPAIPNWGAGPNQVAAVVYHGARGMDQLASKAAGLVRIQEGPNSVVDVVFSHTNADEGPPEENADVRKSQMAEVRSMLLRALTPTELKTEQIYMLGDLNTPGKNQDTGKPKQEWTKLFGKTAVGPASVNSPGIFFACGDGSCSATSGANFDPPGSFMTDTWGFETSVLDVNKTNYVDKQYYDYVLHNKPERQCMQHIRIGSEMQDDVSGTQLSDHLPIHVDFNLLAPHCTPNDDSPFGPQIVKLTTDQPEHNYLPAEGATIKFPGSMQWYKLPDAGTYWIKTTTPVGPKVAFDVYRADDLSDPINPYHGETDPEIGERFVSDVPLYVRVFGAFPDGTPNRTFTGDYSIHFKRALGGSPADSIGLLPADRLRYDWVSSGVDQPIVWFDFYTNLTIFKQFPHSTIVNESGQSSVWLGNDIGTSAIYFQKGANKYDLASYKKVNINGVNPVPYADYHNPKYNNALTGFQVEMPNLKATPSGSGTAPKKYYYKLTRDPFFGPLPQDLYTFVTFLTDLTYVQPAALQSEVPAYDANEPAGIAFQFDGAPLSQCPFGPDCTWLEMHSPTPDPLPVKKALTGPFTQAALPDVWVGPGPVGPGQPMIQIGHAYNGSQVYPIGLAREDAGNAKCHANNNKGMGACTKMFLSQPYGTDYDYVLLYGVVHDQP